MHPLEAPRRLVHCSDQRGFRVVERWHAPGDRSPWHVNDRPALTCVLAGGLEENLRTGSIDCGPQSLLFKPPGVRHANRSGRLGAHCIAIELPDERLPDLRGVRRVASPHLSALLSLLVVELRAADACAPLAVEGLVLELLAAIGRTEDGPRAAGRPAWLDGSLEELRARCRDSRPIQEIAAAAGITPAHFARMLVRHEGCTPTDYLHRLRIEWAKVQLLRTDRSLAVIAMDAGFTDQSHFTRIFARLEGTTPGRFRSRRF